LVDDVAAIMEKGFANNDHFVKVIKTRTSNLGVRVK